MSSFRGSVRVPDSMALSPVRQNIMGEERAEESCSAHGSQEARAGMIPKCMPQRPTSSSCAYLVTTKYSSPFEGLIHQVDQPTDQVTILIIQSVHLRHSLWGTPHIQATAGAMCGCLGRTSGVMPREACLQHLLRLLTFPKPTLPASHSLMSGLALLSGGSHCIPHRLPTTPFSA